MFWRRNKRKEEMERLTSRVQKLEKEMKQTQCSHTEINFTHKIGWTCFGGISHFYIICSSCEKQLREYPDEITFLRDKAKHLTKIANTLEKKKEKNK